jgi:hypothetical protein
METFSAFEYAVTLGADDPVAAYAAAAGAGDALTRVHVTPLGEMRGPRIGPARPVPDSAPVTQRLAAFLGRQP